jgi:hypothetical protein
LRRLPRMVPLCEVSRESGVSTNSISSRVFLRESRNVWLVYFHSAYCQVGCALLSSEIIQITAKRFSYQVGSSAMFVLCNEVYLFQHCWGQGNQYFFGHLQFLAETKVDVGTMFDRYHQWTLYTVLNMW